MILFCEDCGNKNTIGPYQVSGSKAVFRCSSCNYLNTITIGNNRKSPKKSPEQIKKNFIEIVLSTPGVFGFFLFHIETGLVSNHMPSVLLPRDLEIIGKILVSNFKICSSQFPDITRQIQVIEGKNLVLQMINKSCALILACQDYPLLPIVEKLLNRIGKAEA